MEAQFASVKASVQELPGKAEAVVCEKLDQVRAKLNAQKERVDKARQEIKARAEQKVGEMQAAVKDWKEKRDVRKLTARAERAEAYAEAALILAFAGISEAEEAVLEAVAARMDAEVAQKPTEAARQKV